MPIKYHYTRTDTKGNIKYFKNVHDLAESIHVNHYKLKEYLSDGLFHDNYKVEKLDEPFIFNMPKKGEEIVIEGIKCTVINAYSLTFSVLTDLGARLVQIKDMSFV